LIGVGEKTPTPPDPACVPVVALGAVEAEPCELVEEDPAEISVVDPSEDGPLVDVLWLLVLLLPLVEEVSCCARAI
jgi:hypothetical protein